MPTISAGRITRSRANLARRRLIQSDSENGGPGVVPLRSGTGPREAGGYPGGRLIRLVGWAPSGGIGLCHIGDGDFPPLP